MTYPFTAVVGQDEARLALLLCAVNPRIGGVILSGEKGTAKSTVVRGLVELLPGHIMRTLALGTTEDRLVGGLDLEATLVAGRSVLQPGLLSEVDGGVLYIDEVNLLDDHLVDLVIDACAGTVRVEREGLTASLPSRFVLVGTMNPEEGALRPQLLDRFGLCIDVHGESDPAVRAEIIRRRLDHDADPAEFDHRWQSDQNRQAAVIERARHIVAGVRLDEVVTELISCLCRQNHVAGHRADIVMAEATRAHAALVGRGVATEDDVLTISEMVLRHRRRVETRRSLRRRATSTPTISRTSPNNVPGNPSDPTPTWKNGRRARILPRRPAVQANNNPNTTTVPRTSETTASTTRGNNPRAAVNRWLPRGTRSPSAPWNLVRTASPVAPADDVCAPAVTIDVAATSQPDPPTALTTSPWTPPFARRRFIRSHVGPPSVQTWRCTSNRSTGGPKYGPDEPPPA